MKADYTFARYKSLQIINIHPRLENVTVIETDRTEPYPIDQVPKLNLAGVKESKTYEWESILAQAGLLLNGKPIESYRIQQKPIIRSKMAHYKIGEGGLYAGALFSSVTFEVVAPRYFKNNPEVILCMPEIPGESEGTVKVVRQAGITDENFDELVAATQPSRHLPLHLLSVAVNHGYYPLRVTHELTHIMRAIRLDRFMHRHELDMAMDEECKFELVGKDAGGRRPCSYCRKMLNRAEATQFCPVRLRATMQETT